MTLAFTPGCAAPADESKDASTEPEIVDAGLDPKLMYRILLSDIAGQRGRLDVAVRELTAAARESRDPQVARRATRVALHARDHAAGIKTAERWLELEPDSTEARHSYALLLLRNGNTQGAVEALDVLMTHLKDESGQHFAVVGALLAREKDQAAARAVLEGLIQRHETVPEAHLALARMAVVADDSEQALKSAERAYALAPASIPVRSLLAGILARGNEPERALALMASVLEDAPEDHGKRMDYARMLLQADRHEEAREQFRLVRERAPDEPEPLYALALLALEADQPDEAEPYFKRLLDLGKRRSEAAYYLGVIEQGRDHFPQALTWYGQVRKGNLQYDATLRTAEVLMEQGDAASARTRLSELRGRKPDLAPTIYVFEAELLRKHQRPQQALSIYDEALGLHPDNTDLLYARGLLGESLDRPDLLERDLRRILELDPDNAHALNALGFTFAERNIRLEEAEALIRKALELKPDDAAITDSMGWVAYRRGRLEEAEKHLRRALDIEFDGEIAAHLGEVLWVSGHKDEARAIWKTALEKDPQDPALQETLQRLDP